MSVDRIKVALCSNSEKKRTVLQASLDSQELQVNVSEALCPDFLDKLRDHASDVVLININEELAYDENLLDDLISNCPVPFLFEEDSDPDSSTLSIQKAHKLASKLKKLVTVREASETQLAPESVAEKSIINNTALPDKVVPVIYLDGRASNVWILGASVGGPVAVKKFLAELPADIPAAFVLAQHLGENCIDVLAGQLHRACALTVLEATEGYLMKHGEVLVSPMDKRMLIDAGGRVKLVAPNWDGHYHPSIDCVIDDISEHYRMQTGIIMFSGMGEDGVAASDRFFQSYHGQVWAQDAESCVVSSMPDVARSKNIVARTGTPEVLAQQLVQYYYS